MVKLNTWHLKFCVKFPIIFQLIGGVLVLLSTKWFMALRLLNLSLENKYITTFNLNNLNIRRVVLNN